MDGPESVVHLRARVLELVSCLHAGEFGDATDVVLRHCPGLSAGPALVRFTSAIADHLAECYHTLRASCPGEPAPGVEMDGSSPMAGVPRLLSAVVERDPAERTAALRQIAGPGTNVIDAVTAVIAVATATLVVVAAEADLLGVTVPQLVQRTRARWS
jgi:hypothetical protein